ncbi:hypothetical protein AOLI_G00182610 [Acnodon oligacanthus]
MIMCFSTVESDSMGRELLPRRRRDRGVRKGAAKPQDLTGSSPPWMDSCVRVCSSAGAISQQPRSRVASSVCVQ